MMNFHPWSPAEGPIHTTSVQHYHIDYINEYRVFFQITAHPNGNIPSKGFSVNTNGYEIHYMRALFVAFTPPICLCADVGAGDVRLHAAGAGRAGVQARRRDNGAGPLRPALVAGRDRSPTRPVPRYLRNQLSSFIV